MSKQDCFIVLMQISTTNNFIQLSVIDISDNIKDANTFYMF